MPLELADAIAPPEGAGQGLSLDAQLRPAAPGHAHHPAPHPHPRRRDGRQGGARHRLPAQRLREARRRPRLQPVRHHRRSDELHLAGRQRDRLAPRRREAAGHRADAALQVHPHHLRRADAHSRPPALLRRGGPRPRRLHRLPVRLQPEGKDLRHLRDGVRPALPPELHPRRRPAARRRRRLDRQGPRLRQGASPRPTPTSCRLLNRNRIFIDRTKGIGVLSKEDAINLSCTGPIARASGVVRDLRKDEPYLAYKDLDFKVVCADGWRLLRPLPGAHGGDAGEHQDHPRRPSRTCRPGRSTWTSTARWCCPTRWRSTAASRG